MTMARNVELKARLADAAALARVAARAAALSTGGPFDLLQDDTFFTAPLGRLKLRRFGDGGAELIGYRRADIAGPTTSSYVRLPVADPTTLADALGLACEIQGHVRKHRRVYLVGRARIHLDEVDGLGRFVEIEVVLKDGDSEADGAAEAVGLLRRLGLAPATLVEGAYLDLLAMRATGPG
jgi:predicted adenylyl cyclase CyaB